MKLLKRKATVILLVLVVLIFSQFAFLRFDFRFVSPVKANSVSEYYYAVNATQGSTTSTDYSAVQVTLQFTPDSAGDFIIVATAEIQGNTALMRANARLQINSVTCQNLIYVVKDITDWYPFCALKNVSLSGSTTIQIQYASSSTSYTAKILNARILAFKISSFEYAEAETRTTTASTDWQVKLNLTFTPPSAQDYLIMATAGLDGSSSSYSTLTQLIQNDVTVHASTTVEMYGAAGRNTFAVMRKLTLPAQSQTFSLQYCTENAGNTAGIEYTHLIAIPTNIFTTTYYNESEDEEGPAVANTWYSKVLLDYTAQAGNHLIIGSCLKTSASTTQSVGVRLNQSTNVVHNTLVEQYDTTDYEACFLFTFSELSAGSERDSIDFMGENSNSRIKNARLISLSFIEVVDEAPTYSNVATNTTLAGQPCKFSALWNDDVNVSGFIFGTNNTGSWQNETWTTFSVFYNSTAAWSNVTKTLNSTVAVTVQWRFWANDTSNNWNSTNVQTFQTTLPSTLIEAITMVQNAIDFGGYVSDCAFPSYHQVYAGLMFSKNTTADLQKLISYYADNASTWLDCLFVSAYALKYGIENQTAIQLALNNAVMTTGGLPRTSGDGYQSSQQFALMGYYWSSKFNYLTSKWNATKAYEEYSGAVGSNGYNGLTFVWSSSNYTVFALRFYDEYASTLLSLLIFYSPLNQSSALEKAELVWNETNNDLWMGTWYRYSAAWDLYELSAGFFLEDIALYKYANFFSILNWTNIPLDFKTRFLAQNWSSPQWLDRNSLSTYVVVHGYDPNYPGSGNEQRRLEATLAAWAAMLGSIRLLNNTEQETMRNMLLGFAGYDPAWKLLLNSTTYLFDTSTYTFRLAGYSLPFELSNYATCMGLTLLYYLGLVPYTASIALPLEDYGYLYLGELWDNELFQMDINTRTMKIALYNGTMGFQYGSTPFNYTFSQTGVYNITFASDWNSITSAVYQNALPSNRKYLMELFEFKLDFLWTLTQTLTLITLSIIPVILAWSLIQSFALIVILGFQILSMWNVLCSWTLLSLAMRNFYVDLLWSMTQSFSILTALTLKVLSSWNLTQSLTLLTESSFNVLSSLAHQIQWLIGLTTALFAGFSWQLSESWNVISQSIINIFSPWNIGQSLNLIAQPSFNIITSLSQQMQWILNALATLSINFSWNINQSLSLLAISIFGILPSWGLAQSLQLFAQTSFGLIPQWNLTQEWTLLSQSFFNILTNWQKNIQWILEVLAMRILKVDTLWGLAQSFSLLILSSFGVLSSWNLTQSFAVLLQSNFNILASLAHSLTWTLSLTASLLVGFSWQIAQSLGMLTQNIFNLLPQWSLNQTLTALLQWIGQLGFNWNITASWTLITQASYDITVSLAHSIQWLLEVFAMRIINVDLLWSVTQSLTLFASLNFGVLTTWNLNQNLALLTQTVFNLLPQWSLTQSFTVLVQSSFNVLVSLQHQLQWLLSLTSMFLTNIPWAMAHSLTTLLQSVFNTLSQWNIVYAWNLLPQSSYNIVMSFALSVQWLLDMTIAKFYFVGFSWALTQSWTLLLTSAFNILSPWNLSTSLTLLTQSFFNILSQWSLTQSINLLTQSAFNIITSFSLSIQWLLGRLLTLNVLSSWSILQSLLVLTQNLFNISTSWNIAQSLSILTTATFNVLTSILHSLTWLLEISKAGIHLVNLSWALTQSLSLIAQPFFNIVASWNPAVTWSLLTQWIASINIQWNLTQTLTMLRQSIFNLTSQWNLAQTLNLLSQTVYNITLNLSQTLIWLLEVDWWQFTGVAHAVDLVWIIVMQWSIIVEVQIETYLELFLFFFIMFIIFLALWITKKD